MGNVGCLYSIHQTYGRSGLCVWLTVQTAAHFARGLHGPTETEDLGPGLRFGSNFIQSIGNRFGPVLLPPFLGMFMMRNTPSGYVQT